MLQVDAFLICLAFSRDLRVEGVPFYTIGDLSELS